MKTRFALKPLFVAALAAVQPLSITAAESQSDDWYCDLSIYGLGAGMSGDIAIGPVEAEASLPFDQILENLEMCAMGSLRVGRGNWALSTDLVFMALGAAKDGITIDMDQLVFAPAVNYRLNERVELLVGGRFTDIAMTLRGPGVIPDTGTREAGVSWWDAIVGANITQPLSQDWDFTLVADVGTGGSNISWQAFPGVSWQFSPNGDLQMGYRWVYMDYETGSGARYFHYDMLTQGPQVGVRFHF